MGNDKEYSILVVDDQPANIKVIADNLIKEDYQIFSALNGELALKVAEAKKPDLILLDIQMPGMDGFEVCKKLKEIETCKSIPIIFITARTDIEDIVKAFDTGAKDYITKPINRRELLARVKTHLALIKANKEAVDLQKVKAVLAMIVTINHELNQPLTAINGYLTMFKQSLSRNYQCTDQETTFFAHIEKSMKKVLELLEKYREAKEFDYKDYFDGIQMIDFKEKE